MSITTPKTNSHVCYNRQDPCRPKRNCVTPVSSNRSKHARRPRIPGRLIPVRTRASTGNGSAVGESVDQRLRAMRCAAETWHYQPYISRTTHRVFYDAHDEYVTVEPGVGGACAAAGVRAAIAGCVSQSPDNTAMPRPRMLDCMELEDRVLFSATPMAMAVGAALAQPLVRHTVHPLGPQAAAASRHVPSPHAGRQNVVAEPAGKQCRSDRFPTCRQRAIDRGRRAGQQDFRLQQPTDTAQRSAPAGRRLGRGHGQSNSRPGDSFARRRRGVRAWQSVDYGDFAARKRRRHGRNSASVLAVGANIEIFGCNVAAPGSDGQNLLNSLASVTHAAVFASTDSTGAGGNWQSRSGFGRRESRGARRFGRAVEYGVAGRL